MHPIPVHKTIVRVDAEGAVLSRRRSPKRGTALDVFSELVSIPGFITHPGFQVHLALTVEEEYRKHDPTKAWRRRGWVVVERRLVEVEDVIEITGASDLRALLPNDLPEPFTTSDIAIAAGCPRRVAQQMAYCLRHSEAIREVGRRGNAIEYRMTLHL